MRRRLPWILLALILATEAFARLGGGEGYSGGGSSGGGGGGDGFAVEALVRLLIWLVFRHPMIGIPLLILAIVVFVKMKAAGNFQVAYEPVVVRTAPPSRPAPAQLDALRQADRNFSEPVFLDFAQLVYVRAQGARPGSRAELAQPWVAEETLPILFARPEGLEQVRDVVFGKTAPSGYRREEGLDLLDVDFEVNLTEVRQGHERQLLIRERWTFRRKAGVLSPVPERMRTLGCAGCGSTLEPKPDGLCPNCGAPRTRGLVQWEVGKILPLDRRTVEPPSLALGGGTEPGTNLPTRFDPRIGALRRDFEARHPDFSWEAFDARVRETFLKLQQAWSTGRWELARPYETDALFQSHRYWVERYRKFGLVNRLEGITIGRVDVAKVGLDAFYESITVRVFATMRDWTEDASGKVVGGSRTLPRTFSEYWTFLRAVGATRKAEGGTESCPSCGAPLDKINMAGVCEYCGSKLTTGEFDWVVSRIEQDDAYGG